MRQRSSAVADPGGPAARRPSREMRERAEQMAELLGRAAPATRSRPGRRAALPTAFVAVGAMAVGGVGVALSLQHPGDDLALPGLRALPGAADIDGPAARPAVAGSSDGPGDAATAGVSPLSVGAPQSAAPSAGHAGELPATAPAATASPVPATPARHGRHGAPVVTPTADPAAGSTGRSVASTPTSTPTAPTTAAPTTTPRAGRSASRSRTRPTGTPRSPAVRSADATPSATRRSGSTGERGTAASTPHGGVRHGTAPDGATSAAASRPTSG